MNRVPASLAVVLLASSGHHVSPTTLRSWVHRGHITRGDGGYDLNEILMYLTRREGTTMPHIKTITAEQLNHPVHDDGYDHD